MEPSAVRFMPEVCRYSETIVLFSVPPGTGLVHGFELTQNGEPATEAASKLRMVRFVYGGHQMYEVRPRGTKFDFEIKIPIVYGQQFLEVHFKEPYAPSLQLRMTYEEHGPVGCYEALVGQDIGLLRKIVVEPGNLDQTTGVPAAPHFSVDLYCCGRWRQCKVKFPLSFHWLDSAPTPVHNHDLYGEIVGCR